MTINEILKPDPRKLQADTVRRQEKELKRKKARIGLQRAQQKLRDAGQV